MNKAENRVLLGGRNLKNLGRATEKGLRLLAAVPQFGRDTFMNWI